MCGFSSCPCCLLSVKPWGSPSISSSYAKSLTCSVFSIELRDSCHRLRVCMPSPPSLSTNASWTACLLAFGEEGSRMRVLESILRTENVIPRPNLLPGLLLAFPSLPRLSPSQHLLFSPVPPEPPTCGEEEKR